MTRVNPALTTPLVRAAEALVEALSREQAARRAGRWTAMHEQATALASMALELELINARTGDFVTSVNPALPTPRDACTTCGAMVGVEYHPYAYCVLIKAGLDPKEVVVDPPFITTGRAGRSR